MSLGRHVGGLWCGEVLERLSDYLDGDTSPEQRAAIEAHLRGCDDCTRFGGEFGAIVQAVRAKLGGDEDVPASVAAGLDARLGR